jgi:hypothetical protein
VRVDACPTRNGEPVADLTPDDFEMRVQSNKELRAPVTAAVRDDVDGSHWITAELALAVLAPGDYIMELAEGENRMLTAFRVIP